MRLIMAMLAALTFLAACGKKAPLRTPSSEPTEEPDN